MLGKGINLRVSSQTDRIVNSDLNCPLPHKNIDKCTHTKCADT